MNYQDNLFNATDSTDWSFEDALASAVTATGVNTDSLNLDEFWPE